MAGGTSAPLRTSDRRRCHEQFWPPAARGTRVPGGIARRRRVAARTRSPEKTSGDKETEPEPAPEPATSEPFLDPDEGTRRKDQVSKLEDLRCSVNSLLNKACPSKFPTVVERLSALEVGSAEALALVIELVFEKAVCEPHYCETYADLVFALRFAYPEFPAPGGGRPTTFRSAVLSACLREFEGMVACMPQSERRGESPVCEELRSRMRACMRFVGHLFLRQLLSVKVIVGILRELTLCDDAAGPQENAIECACELLNSVGFTLEAMAGEHAALQAVFVRLGSLMGARSESGKALYTRRVQFMIQDVIETRQAGWTRKVFHTSRRWLHHRRASTQILQSAHFSKREGGCEVLVVGRMPLYLTSVLERAPPARAAQITASPEHC